MSEQLIFDFPFKRSYLSQDFYVSENNINAKVTNASFVGNSYQYILSTNIGKIYVISKDTINTFKINDEVFLSLNEKDVKVLND